MRHLTALPLLFCLFLLPAGWGHAQLTDREQEIEPPLLTRQVPLHFKRHNFQALCYDSSDCTVVYNGHQQARQADGKASPPKPADGNGNAWGSTELGIRNFPGPVEVRWTSKDGSAHEASVDIGQIFREELVWHAVPKEKMTDFHAGPVAGAPDIYIEVDDHTISVYTAMFIPTRDEQIPGNKDSDFRKDIFLVWRRIY